jgi:hypothetical protein
MNLLDNISGKEEAAPLPKIRGRQGVVHTKGDNSFEGVIVDVNSVYVMISTIDTDGSEEFTSLVPWTRIEEVSVFPDETA